MNRLYICDHAKECIVNCHHKLPHEWNEDTCTYDKCDKFPSGQRTTVKCILIEEEWDK